MNARSWAWGAPAMLILVLVGCAARSRSAGAARPHDAAMAPAPQQVAPERAPQPAAQTAPAPATNAVKTGIAAVALASAHVIYTGGVTMLEEPDKVPALIDAIIDLAEGQGGRLQGRRDDGVTIRVPSAVFRETMSKIDRLGVVTQRSVTAEDVSEEVHDAEVRLANLQATRKRLQELFAKANDIPTTLTIERELERVSQEIDRIEGRLRFLQARAALSTIDVKIAAKPKPVVAAAGDPTPAKPLPHGIKLPISWLDQLDAAHLSTFE